jgi:hypothetical protein
MLLAARSHLPPSSRHEYKLTPFPGPSISKSSALVWIHLLTAMKVFVVSHKCNSKSSHQLL